MSDIELVIKIPNRIYKTIQNRHLNIIDKEIIEDAIRNSAPLPKGHGRLIDADKFLKDNEAYTGWILDSSDWGGKNAYKDALEDLVNEASTIVEADKTERSDKE